VARPNNCDQDRSTRVAGFGEGAFNVRVEDHWAMADLLVGEDASPG